MLMLIIGLVCAVLVSPRQEVIEVNNDLEWIENLIDKKNLH